MHIQGPVVRFQWNIHYIFVLDIVHNFSSLFALFCFFFFVSLAFTGLTGELRHFSVAFSCVVQFYLHFGIFVVVFYPTTIHTVNIWVICHRRIHIAAMWPEHRIIATTRATFLGRSQHKTSTLMGKLLAFDNSRFAATRKTIERRTKYREEKKTDTHSHTDTLPSTGPHLIL